MTDWTVSGAQHVFAMEIIKGRIPDHPFPRTAEQAATFQQDIQRQSVEMEQHTTEQSNKLIADVKRMIACGSIIPPAVARYVVKRHADDFSPEEMAVIKKIADEPINVREEMLAMAPKFSENDRIRGEGVWEKRGTTLHGVVTKKRSNQSYTIKVCDMGGDGGVLWDGPYTETVVMTPFGYSHSKCFKWTVL